MPETRAIVIEGMPLVRAGISSVLRDQHVVVVAEVASGGDAAVLVRGTDVHLVVVGSTADGGELADLVTRIKARNETLLVVALAPRCTRDQLLAVLDAGADAILPSDVDRDELIAAVRAVRNGERHLASSLATVLFASATPEEAIMPTASPGTGVLTTREHAVVRLLAQGRTNDEIGDLLFISAATVKTHLSHVYAKLGARNRYEAVVKATQLGLL